MVRLASCCAVALVPRDILGDVFRRVRDDLPADV